MKSKGWFKLVKTLFFLNLKSISLKMEEEVVEDDETKPELNQQKSIGAKPYISRKQRRLVESFLFNIHPLVNHFYSFKVI
jgi:hypothetical protein